MQTNAHGSAVELRRAGSRDVAALQRLEQLCFDDPWSEASLRTELEAGHGRVWLCCLDGEAVGSLMAWHLYEDLEINRVAVVPTLRGRGIGALLVRQVLDEAIAGGAARALLEVRADNAAALALYRRTGFAESGRRKGYYHDGMDAVVMTCMLGATPT
jgi:ribosomal-protein-alanine acetyltransferase